MKFRHKHPGCPYDGRQCVQVEPDPAVEPPSQWQGGKSVKVLFDGEAEARWVAVEHIEVVS